MPGASSSPELRALVELRDTARELLALEADATLPDDAIAPTRERAARHYARYVARYGPLNRGELDDSARDTQTGLPLPRWRRAALGGFRADPDALTVLALEVYDAATGTAEPAPILRRRVHGRPDPVARVATPFEALAVCRAAGTVDLTRVAELLGLPDTAAAAGALAGLAFRDPDLDGVWVAASEYLSGDLRARLATARRAAEHDADYQGNIAALVTAVPEDVGPTEIAVSLGAPWVAPADVQDFIHEVLGGRVVVWHLPSAAHWKLVPTGKRPRTRIGPYSTDRMSAYDIITAGLNARSPIVHDVIQMPGRRVHRRNVADTLAAQEKLADLQDRFRVWIWEDAERAARLTAEYNRRFNTFATTRVDGSQLTFPGLADGVDLWTWQRDIVARIISGPATLCGHAVGAGKTRSMVCTAVTARRLGLARTPLITVPAHLVEQTAREARQAYPFGRFLVAGEDAKSRAELAARCATGDWDAVIMSHGSFTALPVAPEQEREWLVDRHADLERQIRAGFGGRYGRTILQRRAAAIAERIERLEHTPRPPLTFDDLGVDLLLVDEAHYFKRLPVVSRIEGISLGSSHRAADLLLKTQILRARRGRLPSLALFTGTPWSNTIAETFVWQTFVQPDVLAAANIESFDAWAAMFVEFETGVEVTPDASGIRLVQRPTRIRNLPELRRMLARNADILPADVLGLERPDHVEDTVVCEPTPGQREYIGALGARADNLRREQVRGEPGEDNMLAVCGDGRRAALDPHLVGVREAPTKVTAIADRVALIDREFAQTRFPDSDVPGVLQLILCDQGTPGADGPQTYGRLRLALVERGIPDDRVHWVHEATTGKARAALFAACRDGAVSVLIGSTDKLGVGVNVQRRLRAIHHADAPWRPSDIEQREGRALRPGNLNPVVDIVRYVTRGSFDAYMWQTLQRKAAFVEQLHRGDPQARTIDDISDVVLSYAEVKALATGNALLLEQHVAAAEVSRLKILQSLDAQALTAARRALAEAEAEQYRYRQQALLVARAGARLDTHPPAGTAAVDALRAATERVRTRLSASEPDPDPAPVRAPWRGLGIELIPAGGWREPDGDHVQLRVTLDHRRVDEIPLPLALIRRSRAAAQRSVLTQIDRWCARADARVTELAHAQGDAFDAASQARQVIDRHHFARADELAAAQARLAEITAALEASVD